MMPDNTIKDERVIFSSTRRRREVTADSLIEHTAS